MGGGGGGAYCEEKALLLASRPTAARPCFAHTMYSTSSSSPDARWGHQGTLRGRLARLRREDTLCAASGPEASPAVSVPRAPPDTSGTFSTWRRARSTRGERRSLRSGLACGVRPDRIGSCRLCSCQMVPVTGTGGRGAEFERAFGLRPHAWRGPTRKPEGGARVSARTANSEGTMTSRVGRPGASSERGRSWLRRRRLRGVRNCGGAVVACAHINAHNLHIAGPRRRTVRLGRIRSATSGLSERRPSMTRWGGGATSDEQPD